MKERRQKLKTYSHLQGLKKIPNEYEISTSRLHYYPQKRFEVKTPITDWYERYQNRSPLQCSQWHEFKDPYELTYTKYTEHQSKKEIFIERIFKSVFESEYDSNLSIEWKKELALFLSVLRFPIHGLQMSAAYVGQIAPESRLTIASALQAANEMRRIHCFSHRYSLLLRSRPELTAENSKSTWESDPSWQPLRRLIENLLVTYDWGEAFVALNMLVKPAFDSIFIGGFRRRAKKNGDHWLDEMLHSLQEDSEWHHAWVSCAEKIILQDSADHSSLLKSWQDKWSGPIYEAFQPFIQLWDLNLNESLFTISGLKTDHSLTHVMRTEKIK